MSDRCWSRKLTFFYKVVKGLPPRYLTKSVNLRSTSNYQTRSANKNNFPEFSCRTESFKHSLFPFCVREWNKVDNTIRDAESIKQLKSMLMNFLFTKTKIVIFDTWLSGCYIAYKALAKIHLNGHNFVIISTTAYLLCRIVVLRQKQPVTFPSLANFLQTKDKRFR